MAWHQGVRAASPAERGEGSTPRQGAGPHRPASVSSFNDGGTTANDNDAPPVAAIYAVEYYRHSEAPRGGTNDEMVKSGAPSLYLLSM